ncbi:STAS domain-containing protein [Natronoflexus pectinivorans]|uniref:Anti-sigma factor antagonist n=1 Tax=Natronoflexus pectinivorans TaxID=682526 RepID=A0A4R2GN27_9BACT|nr:STAS domain-containing protein [Natronoflexus pectinivorans]TCO09095.1 anti-sigma B factor antagonist [Natronoflexus pectinivorans]
MLKTETKNNIQVGKLEGTDRLNAPIAPVVKDELIEHLSKNNYKIVLDLENIRFIDSTGIGVLISILKSTRENNGSFILQNVNKDVMSLLSLMKLDKVFDFSNE